MERFEKLIMALIAVLLLGFAAGCAGNERPDPEIGVAPAVQVPPLPDKLNRRAVRLPDITDGTPGGLTRDGVSTDKKYNDLAYRHNAVLTVYECVRLAVNARDASALKKCLEGDAAAIPETVVEP